MQISHRCIRQTFGKFNKFHSVVTKPGAGRPSKVTDREKRLIKLQQLVIFDGHLNSVKYIDILEAYLPTAFPKYPPAQLPKIFYQDDSARPHVLTRTKNCLKRKRIKQIIWSPNSPDTNIIGNIWSIIDNKLLKFTIDNVDKFINAL